MCAVAGFAFLFLIFAVWNLFQGKTDDALAGFIAGSVLAVIAYALAREQNEAERFMVFLAENETSLKNGEIVRYGDAPVSLTTEATQFMVCLSFVIMTMRLPSRFYLRGAHKTGGLGFIYSVVTLICGWWGIPYGPIYTVAALYRNICGGQKRTIAELLSEIDALKAQEEEKKLKTQAKTPEVKPLDIQLQAKGPLQEKGASSDSPWS